MIMVALMLVSNRNPYYSYIAAFILYSLNTSVIHSFGGTVIP